MLSVIVPATDSPPTLERCVRAIEASRPESAELLVEVLPRGAGPAEARNRAACRARGDVLVFVDSDVVVRPEALRRIEERFQADPALAALFGSYDDGPTARGAVSRFRNLLHHHVHQLAPGPAETFWAGLGAVRADAFAAAGGFDAVRYPKPAVEDIELGGRLAALGLRVELDPCVEGTHLKRWTLRSMMATDFARRGVPWTRLQLERGRTDRGLSLSRRQRAAALAAVALAVAAGARRPRAALGATAVMVLANLRFYLLLLRTGGFWLAAVSVPLHLVHLLTAAASVPAGIAVHVVARARTQR